MRLQAGSPAVRRGMLPDHRIHAVQAGRVVSDDEHGLALWVAEDAATVRRVDLAGEPTRKLPYQVEMTTPTMYQRAAWHPYNSLMLTPPGAGHSVWWTFDQAGEFVGWYVNLETPSARWFGGTDHIDQALDLIVDPDGAVKWKDLGEFDDQCALPALFWGADQARAIRAHADELAALAQAQRYPFDGTWCDFRPDPAWEPAELPWFWDQPTCLEREPRSALAVSPQLSRV